MAPLQRVRLYILFVHVVVFPESSATLLCFVIPSFHSPRPQTLATAIESTATDSGYGRMLRPSPQTPAPPKESGRAHRLRPLPQTTALPTDPGHAHRLRPRPQIPATPQTPATPTEYGRIHRLRPRPQTPATPIDSDHAHHSLLYTFCHPPILLYSL